MRYFLLFILILVSANALAEDINNIKFLSAYDGDTIKIEIQSNPSIPEIFSKNLSVRLAGIDAPEMRGACPLEISWAHKSRETLSALLETADKIDLINVKRDKYFRIVADIYVDGVSVNQEMVSQGLAVRYNGAGKRKDWCLHEI